MNRYVVALLALILSTNFLSADEMSLFQAVEQHGQDTTINLDTTKGTLEKPIEEPEQQASPTDTQAQQQYDTSSWQTEKETLQKRIDALEKQIQEKCDQEKRDLETEIEEKRKSEEEARAQLQRKILEQARPKDSKNLIYVCGCTHTTKEGQQVLYEVVTPEQCHKFDTPSQCRVEEEENYYRFKKTIDQSRQQEERGVEYICECYDGVTTIPREIRPQKGEACKPMERKGPCRNRFTNISKA